MKKFLFFMIIAVTAITFAGCSKEEDKTPPNAASTKTWTFGEQTWSDAIRVPECNKTDFVISNTEPDGRSYTDGTDTWYYYNWVYVNQHAEQMCPSPWRVPTKSDAETLLDEVSGAKLANAWGFGGYAYGNYVYAANSQVYYWYLTKNDVDNSGSYQYGYDEFVNDISISHGLQVRCVK